MYRKIYTMVSVVALSAVLGATSVKADEVELWSFLDPKAEGVRSEVFKHVIDTFEAANPDINVKVNVVQWQQISPSLMRGAQAGQVPDLAMLYSPFIGQHVAAGTLNPLNDRLAEMGEDAKDLVTFPVAKDRDGNIYAVPWELRVIRIVYRKDLLEDAGLDVPDSLPKMIEQAEEMANADTIGFGVGFNPAKPTAAMEWFIPTAIGMGASILNEDGTANFDSPEIRKLITFIDALVTKDKALPLNVALQGDEEVQQYAEAGRTVFMVKGTHRLQLIRDKSGINEGYSWMPFPGMEPATTSPAMLQGWNLAIPKAADNPDGAWKLLQHWTSPEIQAYSAKMAGYLPVRQSVGADASLTEGGNEHIRVALDYANENPLDFDWPENTDFLYATISGMIEQIVADQMSIDEAITWAETQYNQQVR